MTGAVLWVKVPSTTPVSCVYRQSLVMYLLAHLTVFDYAVYDLGLHIYPNDESSL